MTSDIPEKWLDALREHVGLEHDQVGPSIGVVWKGWEEVLDEYRKEIERPHWERRQELTEETVSLRAEIKQLRCDNATLALQNARLLTDVEQLQKDAQRLEVLVDVEHDAYLRSDAALQKAYADIERLRDAH